ncbi:MAG: hypothetical protein IJF40_07340 [Clostridia bacterium]|nr:hypothetical protein [Clostridia bacterium]
MSTTKKSTAIENIITVLAGALLLGFLWRVRGTTGWGSSWGLLNAGFIFTMFIILVKGSRQKWNIGWLALTALSFMMTVPSWGTLLNQITGVLYKAEFWSVGDSNVYVSVASAVFLMLCLGFGLATLFGIMLGRGFSSKQWKLKDFIIVVAAFYIADLISKATISHLILNLIQPQAVEIFEEGLAAAGLDTNVYKIYLEHFNDLPWAKKFDGGRNYFSSIQAISSVIRSAAALLAVRFIVKDKTSAKTGFVVSAAFSFSITISDLFFYFGNGGYHMQRESYFTDFIYPWSCWEYFTGFIAGAIITAFMLKLKDEEDLPELAFQKVPTKIKTVLTFILGYAFMVGVSIVRPVLERFKDTDYQIIFTVAAVIVAVAVVAILCIKWGENAQKISITKFAAVMLPTFIAYVFASYMFIASPDRQEFRDINNLHTILCIVSVAATLVWAVVNGRKKLKSDK